jgi:hypothetical protein
VKKVDQFPCMRRNQSQKDEINFFGLKLISKNTPPQTKTLINYLTLMSLSNGIICLVVSMPINFLTIN